ncbi:MAG TPA: glycosyltransferase [bacterium]|nr:glycosyltransferase [bacterium]HPG46986.1 glycosyltransferase [bacterium]HPM99246.1 glycosyltransferase [bacterium]
MAYTPVISVIIVSYNVRAFLDQALTSILRALKGIDHEIFVVDNASTDGSPEWIAEKYPLVQLIRNRHNMGFARANNQALEKSQGRFVCLINPDTIIQEDTFSVLLDFVATHPDAGAVGCKILNPDGTLQLACRRSFPTPWVAFSKIVGLAKLFPKSRLFGRYNLTYLDPDQAAPVDALSGSFMLVRRETIDKVGCLDESFFMYGEDLDWCYRIQQAGWQNYYCPQTQIIHFKGESSKKSPFAQRRLFYEAMQLFVVKHFSRGQALIPSWMLKLAIAIRAVIAYIAQVARLLALPAIDFFFLTLSLALAIWLRFHPQFPWQAFVKVHLLYSLVWLFSFAGQGLYSRWRFSASRAGTAVLFGWLVNAVLTYFIKTIAFSRAVILYAGAMDILLLAGWRIAARALSKNEVGLFRHLFGDALFSNRSVLVGEISSIRRLVRRLQKDAHTRAMVQVTGIVASNSGPLDLQVEGIPVLGRLRDLAEIIAREKINQVIFSTDKMSYHKILSIVSTLAGQTINYRLVPREMDVMIGKASIDYFDHLPLVDIGYKLHDPFFRFVKRLFDILGALLVLSFGWPFFIWKSWSNKGKWMERSIVGLNGEPCAVRCLAEGHLFSSYSLWLQVLRGRLSMVGRDMLLPLEAFDDLAHLIKPALTGLEQLHQGPGLSKREREQVHLYYLRNYSPALDLQLVAKSLWPRKG